MRTSRLLTLTALLMAALVFPSLGPSFAPSLAAGRAPSASAQAQSAPVESGKFRLHKFAQPLGWEAYTVTGQGDLLQTKSEFEFTDRGTHVALNATLQTTQDLTPRHFDIKGQTSRLSAIDTSISVEGGHATVRQGTRTEAVDTSSKYFTIGGYAPIAVQMMLVRYWLGHGRPNPLKTLPSGEVNIQFRGRENIEVGGRKLGLDHYSISGLIWGRESLWLDDKKELIAAITTDAEFDHFEAIHEGYEDGLARFVAGAAKDGMAELASLSKNLLRPAKGVIAITGGTLIDGDGGPAVPDSVVVIRGDRIVAAGSRARVKIPGGATIIDARGKSVLPGLWDMHAHFEQVEWGPLYLAAGVTTVRDVGNEFDFITAVRDAIQAGAGLGPRILAAGIIDGNGKLALGVIRADNEAEARAAVDRYKAAGFQQIKIYSSIKPEVMSAITAEAHKLGMTVTGHIPEGMGLIQSINLGLDQVNHIQYFPAAMRDTKTTPPTVDPDSEAGRETIRILKEHGTVVDPTVALFEMILHPASVPFATFEPGVLKVAPELREQLINSGVPAAGAERAQKRLDQFLAIIGALHKAGIPIVAGTDQAVPGYSLHREIELYVKAGFTPMEAIQAATIVPARAMKLDKETGSIEAGKLADIILVDGNPLESFADLRKVRTVIRSGQIYDTAPLWKSVGFTP